jgi:hypothetical protein
MGRGASPSSLFPRRAFGLDPLADARDLGARPQNLGQFRRCQLIIEIVQDARWMRGERSHDVGAQSHGVGLALGEKLIVPRLAGLIAANDNEIPLPRRSPVARPPDDWAEHWLWNWGAAKNQTP